MLTIGAPPTHGWERVVTVSHDEVLDARAPWAHVVEPGGTLRIVDLEGNQAVDCLLYNADDTAERYSAPDTIVAQGNIFLIAGSQLLSNEGRPMMTVTADHVRTPRHHRRRVQPRIEHAALRLPHPAPARVRRQLPARALVARHGQARHDQQHQLVHERAGRGRRHPRHRRRHLRAGARRSTCGREMDVLVVISNCPQINNPCNGFDPTPVRLVISR